MTRTYDMPQGAKDALAADPVDYIKRWWMNHSTAEERKAAKVWGPSPYLAIAIKTQAELFAEVANGK